MATLSLTQSAYLRLPGASVAVRVAKARRNGDEGRHQRQEGRHDVPQDLHPETRQCQVSQD